MYFVAGVLSLATGLLGLVLPLLPTTCFILLAAYCFSKSSDRWYNWLISHPRFGSTILNWQKYRVIRVPIKCWASTMILISIVIMWFTPAPVFVKLGITGFLFGLILFIWRQPHEVPVSRR